MMPNIRTKNIYEAIMHRQRIAEAKKQCDRIENKKFFQDSDVRARQEKRWTSETSFNNRSCASGSRDEFDEESDSLSRRVENAVSDSEISDAIESKTVVYDSHESDERQHDIALQRKMNELKQFEREKEELAAIEKEILEDQRLLQTLATERRENDEARLQRRFERVLLRQHTAALIRRSRQVQAEITDDLAWIDRLLALGDEEEGNEEKGPRSHIIAAKKVIEKDLCHEARWEKDMDEMLASEAAELARKREQEWKCQEDARARLLNEVLSVCQDCVESRLQALEQMKSERAERYEALRREINAADLQRKPLLRREYVSSENCNNVAETEEPDRRCSHAEATFEETLRKEAEKLNVSADELKKVTSGKAPFADSKHKTHLW
ncbi:Trichoplein keratin filament-binding protein [Taenia crassiceps]|uniref:Trichoplein keratin filament-binding protein n=1 Tax=Taenia crassiceps TaxID=6207 RepID=A0ABR4QAK1_9CEST